MTPNSNSVDFLYNAPIPYISLSRVLSLGSYLVDNQTNKETETAEKHPTFFAKCWPRGVLTRGRFDLGCFDSGAFCFGAFDLGAFWSEGVLTRHRHF